MEIKKIEGDMCNVYIIEGDKIILVDAGAKIEYVKKVIQRVDYIFITHAHFDHIYYLNDYLNFYSNCRVLLSETAYKKLFDNSLNGAFYFGIDLNINLKKDKVIFIKENDSINDLANENYFVELKGHTDCSLGLVINEHLFLGDVLFFNGIGRYDLPTGSMQDTLLTQEKLKKLKGISLIYSGHSISPFAYKNKY